jgi:ABC-type tungstate transport system permease subunit/GGDEF domain-containing protein
VSVLIERFEKQNPSVRVELTTTGALNVMEQAKQGKFDFILSHYPTGEKLFITDGSALHYAEIMYNYFAIIGPQNNDLDFSNVKNLKDVLQQLSEHNSDFFLPNPRSGTFQKIQSLASHYNIPLDWPYLINTHTDVKQTLQQADEMEAFTFADMGSYLNLKNRFESDMVPIYRDDFIMQNHIMAIVVNPKQYPQVNIASANLFWAFLIDDNTQQFIAQFGHEEYGYQLFTPVAHLDNAVIAERSHTILKLQQTQVYYQTFSIVLLTLTLFTLLIIYLLQQSAKRQKQLSEERFSNNLNPTHEGILDYNYKTKSGYISKHCKNILESQPVKHQNILGWLASIMEAHNWQAIENTIKEYSQANNTAPFACDFRLKHDRKERSFRLRARLSFSETKELEYMVGAISDLSEEASQQILLNHFMHLATHDNLTQLPNKMLFQERLEETIKSSDRDLVDFALFFIDLDGFKQINDLFGHQIGDKLLIQVAEQLVNCVRKTDLVSRFGGDEFVILLPNISKNIRKILSRRLSKN